MQIVGLKCLQSMIINTTLHQLHSTAQKKSTWRFSPMLHCSSHWVAESLWVAKSLNWSMQNAQNTQASCWAWSCVDRFIWVHLSSYGCWRMAYIAQCCIHVCIRLLHNTFNAQNGWIKTWKKAVWEISPMQIYPLTQAVRIVCGMSFTQNPNDANDPTCGFNCWLCTQMVKDYCSNFCALLGPLFLGKLKSPFPKMPHLFPGLRLQDSKCKENRCMCPNSGSSKVDQYPYSQNLAVMRQIFVMVCPVHFKLQSPFVL